MHSLVAVTLPCRMQPPWMWFTTVHSYSYGHKWPYSYSYGHKWPLLLCVENVNCYILYTYSSNYTCLYMQPFVNVFYFIFYFSALSFTRACSPWRLIHPLCVFCIVSQLWGGSASFGRQWGKERDNRQRSETSESYVYSTHLIMRYNYWVICVLNSSYHEGIIIAV